MDGCAAPAPYVRCTRALTRRASRLSSSAWLQAEQARPLLKAHAGSCRAGGRFPDAAARAHICLISDAASRVSSGFWRARSVRRRLDSHTGLASIPLLVGVGVRCDKSAGPVLPGVTRTHRAGCRRCPTRAFCEGAALRSFENHRYQTGYARREGRISSAFGSTRTHHPRLQPLRTACDVATVALSALLPLSADANVWPRAFAPRACSEQHV